MPDADELLARFRRPFRGLNTLPIAEDGGALVSVDVEVSGLATGLIEAGCISGFTLFLNHYAETGVVQNLPLHEFSRG